MEEELLNGFSSSDVFRLYKFLCIYESKLVKLKKSESLFAAFPQLEDAMKGFIKRFTYNQVQKDDMQAEELEIPVGVFYCTKSKSQPVGLLYHIRNSIAHGQIERNEQIINLVDYDFDENTKSRFFSGRGVFDSGLFFEIIDFVNANIAM